MHTFVNSLGEKKYNLQVATLTLNLHDMNESLIIYLYYMQLLEIAQVPDEHVSTLSINSVVPSH